MMVLTYIELKAYHLKCSCSDWAFLRIVDIHMPVYVDLVQEVK